MWMTVKRIACEEVGVGENERVELFRFSFFLLPLLPSPSAPFTHKIQQQSCGSYTNFFFFCCIHHVTGYGQEMWQLTGVLLMTSLVFAVKREKWVLSVVYERFKPVRHALKRTCNCIRKNGELIWHIDFQRFRKTICFFLFLSNKEITEIQYSSSLQEVVVKNVYH